MFKLGNGNNSKANHRQIPHSRIDDEEIIFKKYELGRKLGHVKICSKNIMLMKCVLFEVLTLI